MTDHFKLVQASDWPLPKPKNEKVGTCKAPFNPFNLSRTEKKYEGRVSLTTSLTLVVGFKINQQQPQNIKKLIFHHLSIYFVHIFLATSHFPPLMHHPMVTAPPPWLAPKMPPAWRPRALRRLRCVAGASRRSCRTATCIVMATSPKIYIYYIILLI